MKKRKKENKIVPTRVSQHIEEEFRKNRRFRDAYINEITRLKLAKEIRQLRQKRKLTQAQLAKRIGTSQQTISRLEDFKNMEMTLLTLAKIAIALRAKLKIDLVPKKKQEVS